MRRCQAEGARTHFHVWLSTPVCDSDIKMIVSIPVIGKGTLIGQLAFVAHPAGVETLVSQWVPSGCQALET
jgi:hypothetical protein